MNMFTDETSHMDFNNNYRGRYYASKTSLSRGESFNTALSCSELNTSLSHIDSNAKYFVYTIYTGSI